MSSPDTSRRLPWSLSTLAFVFGFLAGGAWAQDSNQAIEASDLTELWGTPDAELRRLATEVESTCRSLEQVRSVPLFSDLIDRLDAIETGDGELEPEGRDWRRLALSCRAEALFNLRRGSEAERDLERLFELDPAFDAGTGGASARLVELAAAVRARTIGEVRWVANPPDLTIEIDGEPVDVDAEADGATTLAMTAGSHTLTAARPGHEPLERELVVTAGATEIVDINLRRVSAVLAVWTRPCDVLVSVDGAIRGSTAPPAQTPGDLAGGSDQSPAEDPGCLLTVDGVGLGSHVLELTHRGHRGVRASFQVDQLIDFSLPLQRLRITGGELVLRGVRPGSVVRVDEVEQFDLETTPDGGIRLDLAIGTHRIGIAYDTVGFFETEVTLEDKEEHELDVELRPRLAFLGVLGGDPEAAADLEKELGRAFGSLERLTYGPAGCRGAEVLEPFGVLPARLLAFADTEPSQPTPWDDAELQSALDGRCRASAYLLAILPPGAFPDRADLWLWPAAPGPSRPSIHRIRLPAADGLASLRDRLDRPLKLQRPSLGARFIDTLAAAGPITLGVTPGGPASAAGLAVGDEIASWNGAALTGAAELRALVATAESGDQIALEVRRAGATVALEVAPVRAYRALSPADRHLHPAAASAQLALLESGDGDDIDQWVLDLNWAAILMLAEEWGQAARRLRAVDAPAGSEFGQAVVDYWFARALERDAGSAYRERAREALGRAALDSAARLGGPDGPRVAPRAGVLLRALESAPD